MKIPNGEAVGLALGLSPPVILPDTAALVTAVDRRADLAAATDMAVLGFKELVCFAWSRV